MTPASLIVVFAVASPRFRKGEPGTCERRLPGRTRRAGRSAKARPHFVRAAEWYEAARDAGTRSPAVARNLAQSPTVGRRPRPVHPPITGGACGGSARPRPAERAGIRPLARRIPARRQPGRRRPAARTPASARPAAVSFVRLAAVAVGPGRIGWLDPGSGVGHGPRRSRPRRRGRSLWRGPRRVALWEDGRRRAHWASRPRSWSPRHRSADRQQRRVPEAHRWPTARRGGAEVLSERGGWLHVELAAAPSAGHRRGGS